MVIKLSKYLSTYLIYDVTTKGKQSTVLLYVLCSTYIQKVQLFDDYNLKNCDCWWAIFNNLFNSLWFLGQSKLWFIPLRKETSA